MPPGQFELFCCELLQREFALEDSFIKIINIEPLAGTGHGQYGADIFVEKSNGNETWVAVYEVKRVKGFGKADYKKALKRFVDRLPQWKLNIKEFTVISSEFLTSALIAEWKGGASRTLAPNIELYIWSSWQLDEKVKRHPALVFKYFDPAWMERLFGEEGLAHFEKYGYYEFEESASWVNYSEPSQGEYADLDLFSVQNEHIRISGFLPSLTEDRATCYYERRLKDREETWKSKHFSLVSGMGSAVPLLEVKR
jgi:hypothetical protein